MHCYPEASCFHETEVSYLELFQLWLTCREKKNMGPSLCWKAKGASEKESLAVCSPPSCIRDIHSSLLKVRLLVLRRDRERATKNLFPQNGWRMVAPSPPPPFPPGSLPEGETERYTHHRKRKPRRAQNQPTLAWVLPPPPGTGRSKEGKLISMADARHFPLLFLPRREA